MAIQNAVVANAENPSIGETILCTLRPMTSEPALDPDLTRCPRCHDDLSGAEFYGVCASCATNLRAVYDGSPRNDIASSEYEPKMNVTPNAVASKD
jgi:uncharacterized protein with PIN domain